jgi:predicted DNA-binding transcriptional regulator AlpA
MAEQIDRLMNQKQVAEILGMSEAWLEISRFKKTGIPYIKIGRAVRYRTSDVNLWLEKNAQSVE